MYGQYLNQSTLVGSDSFDGFAELLRLEQGRLGHQSHDYVFEVSPQLALELLYQIFPVHRFESGYQLLPLGVASLRDDIDDGTFVIEVPKPLKACFKVLQSSSGSKSSAGSTVA